MSYQPTLCYQCFGQRPEGPGPCPHCGWNPTAGREKYPLALPCGSILAGRYLVGRALGQGGFGITYVARDLTAGRLVAIKEYLPEGIALHDPERLVGREVVNEGDGRRARIREVMCGPANDVWVLDADGAEVLVPVVDEVVSEVPAEGPIPVSVPRGVGWPGEGDPL